MITSNIIDNISKLSQRMTNQLKSKVISATKWSAITEVAAKLVSPISTMVLARLLTPDAFGVMVTATMVISFAEIFTDAGFQKYIVQHEFENDDDKYKSTAVAFWANLILSLSLWLGISLFANPIARLVGCEGHGLVIVVSCVCIPLAAFSSIQMALFRRDLDFKTLFGVRLVGILIPIVVTIPLAVITRSYWSLIIGMVALNFSNALLLTIKSKWKPKWYFSISRFKNMFSFTAWSMLEAVSIWMTSYVDIFIVGTMLSQHYLGLYRTSMNTVGQITSIITAATTPVLFSSLSRLQDDRKEFNRLFFKFQKYVGILVIPLGMGIFLFSDLITKILLGEQWMEASHFIGLWGLTSAITIVLSHYASEVYRSIGKPKLSVISQWLHIVVLLPVVYIFATKGFETLCTARSLVRLEGIIVNLIILKAVVKMSVGKMMLNVLPEILAASSMLLILLLPVPQNIFVELIYVIICLCAYLAITMIFHEERHIIIDIINKVIKQR